MLLFYVSLFLVLKVNGTFRPILHVSKLNVHILCPHFKMETVQSVCAAVHPRLDSIDLQDVYLHVPIHLLFTGTCGWLFHQQKCITSKTLPFGLSTAPLVFTRIVENLAGYMRQMFSLHVHVYLDDWLFRHQQR